MLCHCMHTKSYADRLQNYYQHCWSVPTYLYIYFALLSTPTIQPVDCKTPSLTSFASPPSLPEYLFPHPVCVCSCLRNTSSHPTPPGGLPLLVGDLSPVPQDEGTGPEAAEGVEGGKPRDREDVGPGGRGFQLRPADRGDSAGDRLEWAHSRVQQQAAVRSEEEEE